MTLIPQPSENVKALAAALDAAIGAANAYYPDAERAHGDFDREDLDGTVWHDAEGKTEMPDGSHMPCPYCALNRAKQAYFSALRQHGLKEAERIEEWTHSKNYLTSIYKDRAVTAAWHERERARERAAREGLGIREQIEANAALEFCELQYTALWSGMVMRDSTFFAVEARDKLRAKRDEAIDNFEDPADFEADLWWLENKLRLGPPVLEDVS